MKHVAACLLFAVAAACAAVQPPPWSPGPPAVAPAPGPGELIVSQPATIPVYNDRSPPRGTVGVTRWQMRERPGDVVSADGVLSISIDSASSLHASKGTIVLGVNLATPVQPFAAGKRLRYSFDLAAPHASVTGNAVAHVVAYVSLNDRTSDLRFWLGRIVFDTRCSRSGEVVKWDAGTDRPIVNTVAPDYRCQPSTDWRPHSFVVGAADVAHAVGRIKAQYPAQAARLSSNPTDYELRHLNANPEVHSAPGEHARIAVEVRNWRLVVAP